MRINKDYVMTIIGMLVYGSLIAFICALLASH